MNIKWKAILVVLPTTILAFMGLAPLFGWLAPRVGAPISGLILAPLIWCTIATGISAERQIRSAGRIGPM